MESCLFILIFASNFKQEMEIVNKLQSALLQFIKVKGSQEGSQEESQAGSKEGSQEGSQVGSQEGSQVGSQVGSREGSQKGGGPIPGILHVTDADTDTDDDDKPHTIRPFFKSALKKGFFIVGFIFLSFKVETKCFFHQDIRVLKMKFFSLPTVAAILRLIVESDKKFLFLADLSIDEEFLLEKAPN